MNVDFLLAAKEYLKCKNDYSYYAEKYIKTFDQTNQGYVSFKMFKQQKELIQDLKENDYVIVNKGRQTGISTTCALECSAHMLFNDDRKVAIVAHKLDGSKNFLSKVIEFIEDKPSFLGDIRIINKSMERIALSNGSEARAYSSSAGSLRGFTPTMLVFDEAAHLEGNAGIDLWTGTQPSLATGGRCVILSTPRSQDKFFYPMVRDAKLGKNGFKLKEIFWWRDERYNNEIEWLKFDDRQNIIEKIRQRKTDGMWCKYNDKNHLLEENLQITDLDYERLYRQGYKPESPWFKKQRKSMNNDKRRIAQEYELAFLGSGDNVINVEIINEADIQHVEEPKRIDTIYKEIFYWDDYDENKQYLLTADVSSGSSDDSSTCGIVNVTDMCIVAEYAGKVGSDELAHIIKHMGDQYGQPLAVVDVTSGHGENTCKTLREISYSNIYQTVRSRQTADRASTKVDGIFINAATRPKMIDRFRIIFNNKEMLIRSRRFLEELKTFEFVNGRADHKRSTHDDIIWLYIMACWIIVEDFQSLANHKEQTQKILQAVRKQNKAFINLQKLTRRSNSHNPYVKYKDFLG